MSGKFSATDKQTDEMRLLITRYMTEDGLSDTLPPHRVSAFTDPDELELAMVVHRQQHVNVLNSLKFPHFHYAATHLTGSEDRKPAHESQLLEAYIHASAAAMEAVDSKPASMSAIARDQASGIVSRKSRSGMRIKNREEFPSPDALVSAPKADPAPSTLVTRGVKLIEGPISHAVLDIQFQTAADAAETHDLDRSPKTSPFSHDLAGVCERSIRRAQADGRMDDKTALGRRMSVKLFMVITGQQLVTDVEQHHLRIFMNALKTLPANFLKSESDRTMTYPEVSARASTLPDDKLGRSAGTSNKHLDTIGAIIKYARVQDKIEVDRDIDPSSLRVTEHVRSRNKRTAFERKDVIKLFKHPIWTGCKGQGRRHDTGDAIVKDGLYWVPLIIHYTGARIEEIAGLPVSAIIQEGEHWGLDIAPHTERRLKNIQSERLLPIHEHLICLGLIRHRSDMAKRGEEFMFPELRPSSSKAKFAKKMKYNWDKARRQTLGDAADDLTMHSLRHYVNISLKADKTVEKSVRMDILGHAAEDLNEEVYSSGSAFHEKLTAINAIPRAY